MSKNNIHTIEGTVSTAQAAQIVAKKKEKQSNQTKNQYILYYFLLFFKQKFEIFR